MGKHIFSSMMKYIPFLIENGDGFITEEDLKSPD